MQFDISQRCLFQDKKREIVASAFGEQEGGGTSRLSMEDLAFLFRSDAR